MANEIQNNGLYVIMNVRSRTVFDLNDGGSGNGTKVQGWDFSYNSAGENQVWQFQRENDAWRIINGKSGTSLDLNNGSANNGTKIQGWQKGDTDAQRWILDRVPGNRQVARWT